MGKTKNIANWSENYVVYEKMKDSKHFKDV